VEEKSQKFQLTFQTAFVTHLGKRKGKTQNKEKEDRRKKLVES